jgi:membrane protein
MDRLRHSWLRLSRLLLFGVRVVAAFVANRGILLAGGVGYNALLSLVPFLTVAVATLSVFFDEASIIAILGPELKQLVPQHADLILHTAGTFLHHQGATGVVSMGFLLFFSGVAFRMLEEAVAAIFGTPATGARRSILVSALIPYGFVVLLMTALFFMTLLTSSLDALGSGDVPVFGVAHSAASRVRLLLRLAGLPGLVVLFAGIYWVLPVVKISLRRALIGGLCAAVLWRLVGFVMAYYFANISTVGLVYGSLATVIVVLIFLEAAFIILLLCAQVIAELEASAAAGLRWYEKRPTAAPLLQIDGAARPI